MKGGIQGGLKYNDNVRGNNYAKTMVFVCIMQVAKHLKED